MKVLDRRGRAPCCLDGREGLMIPVKATCSPDAVTAIAKEYSTRRASISDSMSALHLP